MFWKVYRKGVIKHIDKVWFIATMSAQDVMDTIEDEYDFPVTILPDEID